MENGQHLTLPPRRRKRYTLPPGLSCREFVVRELDGLDDLEIAIWSDRRTDPAVKDNVVALIEVKQQEGYRCALVEVDGVHVNLNGVPFSGMDRWSHRTMVFLANAFNELNGVEAEELKKFRAAAVEVETPRSRPAPPIDAQSAA